MGQGKREPVRERGRGEAGPRVRERRGVWAGWVGLYFLYFFFSFPFLYSKYSNKSN
jgi:hypothetical protein